MTTETNIANTATADTIETNDATDTITEVPMRVLKVATCPSLSGLSELTYHVGCNESGVIHFRIWANSGGGLFSSTWFSMAEVSKLLTAPDGISSSWLQPLWDLTSRNNPGFTLALLQGEGLVEKSVLNPRTYRTVNPASFLERINALIAAGVDLGDADEALQATADVAEADVSEVDASAVMPAAKRGRPSKRA